MTRLLTLAATTLVCGLVYLIATGIAVPEVATDRAMFIVSATALLVALIAAGFAATAALRVRTLRGELKHLARSVDAALAEMTAERKREAVRPASEPVPAAISASIPDPIPGITVASPATQEVVSPRAGNVVPHPAAIRGRPNPAPTADAQAPVAPSEIVAALQRALSAGSIDVSLVPIVATGNGDALGFDVLAHLRAETGPAIALRHLDLAEPSQAAVAERLLVAASLQAARQPGGEAVPLHVAISAALLDDRFETSRLIDLLKRDADAARRIVLCLPMAIMQDPASRAPTLARLAATGLRFSAEGWPRSTRDLEGIWRSGVSYVRLPAARLLADATDSADEPDWETVVQTLAASAMAVIATDIRQPRDAVALVGRGVAMMTTRPLGEHQGAPAAGPGHGAGLRQAAPSEG